jgi:hypothetical protein
MKFSVFGRSESGTAEDPVVAPAEHPVQEIHQLPKTANGDGETPASGIFTAGYDDSGKPNGDDSNGDIIGETSGSEVTATAPALSRRDRLFAYMKTREFWIVLIMGYVLMLSSIFPYLVLSIFLF